jgi:polyisoprenoid-binding protein YceI
MRKRATGFAAIAMLLGPAAAAHAANAATWKVDLDHTTVGFTVSHLFTRVHGRFDSFEGTIEFDPANPEATIVRGTIDARSVNTNNERRDRDLRSDNFFDVEKYPTLTFESTGVREVVGTRGKLEGQLTIHGVTRAVVLDVAFLGQGTDPWGNVRAGFTGTLKINRKEFGLNWNEVLETGGVLVGDEVEIRIDAEGIVAE